MRNIDNVFHKFKMGSRQPAVSCSDWLGCIGSAAKKHEDDERERQNCGDVALYHVASIKLMYDGGTD